MHVEFDEIETVLRESGAEMGAAEAHGALCGCLAMSDADGEVFWIQELYGSEADRAEVKKCREALSGVYAATLKSLHDEHAGFHLLLPSDEVALGLRVEALGQWCYGLSAGLFLTGLTPERLAGLPEEFREFLDDVNQIAQVSPEMVAYDESEADFVELAEYVRMGMVSLFDELQTQKPPPGLH